MEEERTDRKKPSTREASEAICFCNREEEVDYFVYKLFSIIRFDNLTQFFFKVENIIEVCDLVFSLFLILIES